MATSIEVTVLTLAGISFPNLTRWWWKTWISAQRGRAVIMRQRGKSRDGKRKAATDQLPAIRENPYRGIRLRVYNNRTVSSGHIATMATRSHKCEVLKPVVSVCNAGRVQLFVADVGTTPLYRLEQRSVLRLFCGRHNASTHLP